MKFHLVLLTLTAYIIGILSSGVLHFSFLHVLITCIIIFALFISIYNLTRESIHKKKVLSLAIVIVFFMTGFYLTDIRLNYRSSLVDIKGSNVSVKGVVSKQINYNNRTVYWLSNPTVNTNEQCIQNKIEKIQLTVYEPSSSFDYGDIVEVRGILNVPEPKRNPGGFDYKKYLQARNIYTVIGVSDGQAIKSGEIIGNPLLKAASLLRSRINQIVDNLPANEKSILLAILLGDKSGLTPENRQIFQGIGIMHIFAVSGLHVGFLIFFIVAITNLLKLPSLIGKNNTNLIIMACLILYCAVTGFSSPVVRASIMLGIYFFGRDNWNNIFTANALFLSALIILLINPLYLFDAGFQFTFCATAFIIFISPILRTNKHFKIKNEMIAVSLSAWLGTLPLTMYYFNHFAPLGIISSVPAGFMAGIVIALGFITLIADLFHGGLAQIFVMAVGGTIYYSQKGLFLLSKIPLVGEGSFIATPKIGSILFFYVAFVLTFIAYFHRFNPHFRMFVLRKSKQIAALILIILILIVSINILNPPVLEVVFLDVGQGDCIFIKTPSGHTILIDGGDNIGDYNMGDLVAVPFLRHKGIKKLDLVINSHPDADHLAGLYPVLKEYPVGIILIPTGFDEDYEYLKEIVRDKGINYTYSSKGQAFQIGEDVFLNVLHPPMDYSVSLGSNNNSLVVELVYKDISFLFTGDIEEEAINHMLPYTTQSNVLKFPHHGSQYSFNEEYLAKVNPEVVVIQVGARNPFGHPGKNVLEYFETRGVPVYRNDLHGAITVYSKGQRIDKVETVIE